MKNWITRFGMLAVLGSLVCGLMVAGCGGAPEDEGTGNAANAPAATAPEDGS